MNRTNSIKDSVQSVKRKRGRPPIDPAMSKAKSDADRAREYRLRKKQLAACSPKIVSNSASNERDQYIQELKNDLAVMADMLGQMIDYKTKSKKIPSDLFKNISKRHFEIHLKYEFI